MSKGHAANSRFGNRLAEAITIVFNSISAIVTALNAVVKEYINKNDVLFISLAFDSKEKLESFLTKTKFDYAVIPVEQKYLQEKLKVTQYPTQFIINRKGLISKVVTNYHDMISVLKNELSKSL